MTTIHKFAKALRQRSTNAEKRLWKLLSNRQLHDLKFRRQVVVMKKYIADFYCASIKLIIEVDGSIHDRPDIKAKDAQRTKVLKEAGYTILRFSNIEVLKWPDEVLVRILREYEKI